MIEYSPGQTVRFCDERVTIISVQEQDGGRTCLVEGRDGKRFRVIGSLLVPAATIKTETRDNAVPFPVICSRAAML